MSENMQKTKKLDRLIQILVDAENQPHQFVDDYDEVKLLMEEAFEESGWKRGGSAHE